MKVIFNEGLSNELSFPLQIGCESMIITEKFSFTQFKLVFSHSQKIIDDFLYFRDRFSLNTISIYDDNNHQLYFTNEYIKVYSFVEEFNVKGTDEKGLVLNFVDPNESFKDMDPINEDTKTNTEKYNFIIN